MKKKLEQLAMVAFVVGTLSFGGGCAFGDRQVSLRPVYAYKIAQATTKQKVQVTLPEDGRNIKQTNTFVGYVRNGYGMHTASVFSKKTINDWVQECIVKNLKNAGFNVTKEKKTTKGLYISTLMQVLECDAQMQYNARVILKTKLKKDDFTLFEQTFSGNFKQTNWAASSSGYQQCLTKAMKQCVDRMIPALARELEKYQPSITQTAIASTAKTPKTVSKVTTITAKPKSNQLPDFLK